jgi:acyl-CoA reductase-like NAD-dependent aldehyde dehydrogenase
VSLVFDHLVSIDRENRIDPATAEELGTVPEMGLEETKEAIEAASKAFPSWSRTTAKVSSL